MRMKTRLIRIGNSRGIRLPKPLIEAAGLEDEVELVVTPSGIAIQAVQPPRTGWAEAARAMADREEDGLLDEPSPTQFEEEEWTWE